MWARGSLGKATACLTTNLRICTHLIRPILLHIVALWKQSWVSLNWSVGALFHKKKHPRVCTQVVQQTQVRVHHCLTKKMHRHQTICSLDLWPRTSLHRDDLFDNIWSIHVKLLLMVAVWKPCLQHQTRPNFSDTLCMYDGSMAVFSCTVNAS